jgi:hypothetical protein
MLEELRNQFARVFYVQMKECMMSKHLRQYGVLIVAGAIIIGGIAIQAFQFYHDFPLNNRMLFISGQESQELYLEEGEYVLFYEYESKKYGGSALQLSLEDRLDDVIDHIQLKVNKLPENEELQVHLNTAFSYSLNGIVGESLYGFHVVRDGNYSVQAEMDTFLAENKAKFSLVADFSESILQFLKQLAQLFLLAVPFVLLGLYIYWREEGRKRQLQKTI